MPPDSSRFPRPLRWTRSFQSRFAPSSIALALALTGLTPGSSAEEPPPPARSTTPHEATIAQGLFDRARTLMAEENYEQACPLLAESHRLEPSGGTVLNLAVCYERQGKTATAHTHYHMALSFAIRENRIDRQTIARDQIRSLDPRLRRLELVFTPGAGDVPGLTLNLDGHAIPTKAWGTPIAVDPGKHLVSIQASGFVPKSLSFHAQRDGDTTKLSIPKLAPLSNQTSPPPPLVASRPAIEQNSSLPKDTHLYLAFGGAASAALAIGSGVLAWSANNEANELYDDAGCLPERRFCADPNRAQQAQESQNSARTWAWVSAGTSVVAAGAWVGAWLLWPKSTDAPAVSVDWSPDRASLHWSQSW